MLLQYYVFLRLGKAGFHAVQSDSRTVAKHLASGIADVGPFELWNDGSDIPVFAWRLKEGHSATWTLYDLQDRLRMRGWIVPAYPMPDDLADVVVQRIVVRNGLSMDLADRLLADIRTETAFLDALTAPMPDDRPRPGFHH